MRLRALHLMKIALAGRLLLAPLASFAVDKSGVSPNTISLPNGPGSLEGLGEAFQPSLNSGTGKQRFPLELPAGTPGPTPQVVLRYEGGSGNGVLGYGWSLSRRYIQRQTDQGIPLYQDDPDSADAFINGLKEELVPVEQNGRTNFFCENEGPFLRYRRVGDHWEGTLPNGIRLMFGESEAARVAHPNDAAKTFRWLLERQVDTHGNTVRYQYTSRPGSQNANQKFCTAIEYGPGPPPWEDFHFVVFEYEDRGDWFEDGRPGFALRTGSRIRRIVIGTQGPDLPGHLEGDFNRDGTPDFLNRSYELKYLESTFPSLLESVTLIGADGSSTLPPAKYHYTDCSNADTISAKGKVIRSVNEPPVLFHHGSTDLIDLNGDALPDLLRTPAGAAHSAYLNQGPSREDPLKIQWSSAIPVNVPEFDQRAWEVEMDSQQAHLADMDGDGLADLVEVTAFATYFYPNEPAPGDRLNWGPRNPISIQDFPPPAPYGSPDVRTGDIDFDKRIDIIQSIPVGNDVAYQIWFNREGKQFSPRTTVIPPAAYRFSETGVHLTDYNGDRVPDVVKVRPTGLRIIAGLGHGNFTTERSVLFPNALVLEESQVADLQLQDVNGDGLADLLLPGDQPGQIWFWINRGNYTLAPRRRIVDGPSQSDPDGEFRWADLNGNGTTDLIYADSGGLQAIDLGELMGCVPKPHLLSRAENGIGRIQTIQYRTTTHYVHEDGTDESGRYSYSWPDPLPFPVTVISRITTADSLGNEYVTRFQYHDGYYDPEEKQFRGFARAEQLDVGDATAPTLVTKVRFDTGRIFDAMKGKIRSKSTAREGGGTFGKEQTFWADPPRLLMTGVDGREVHFAHPTGTRRSIYELGRGKPKVVETEMDFDDFGNQILNAEYGVVDGDERGVLNDERITKTQYARNPEQWLLRFPKRRELQDLDGNVISRTEFFYDDESFSGSNWGEVTTGDQTLTRQWTDPSQVDAWINARRTRYDSFGNPVALLDPLAKLEGGNPAFTAGHMRTITYDPFFHSFPTKETIYVGDGSAPLVYKVDYDAGFGALTESTGFNGHKSTYGYDAFGRLIRTIRPGDSPDFPTEEYDYMVAESIGEEKTINYVEARRLDTGSEQRNGPKHEAYFISRQFIDGLGRNVMTKHEGEAEDKSGSRQFVVEGAVLFNARKRPERRLNPYFSNAENGLEFEDITAAGWTGLFQGEDQLVPLNLEQAHATRFQYDALLREIRTVQPDQSFRKTIFEPLTERRYDENDTDPDSPHFDTPKIHYQDGLGRLIRVDESVWLDDDGTRSESRNSWSTTFEFRADELLLRTTDAQGNVKSMNYDGLGRKTSRNDPDRGWMDYRYDDASNLIQTVDGKGQRITYTYDGANRLLAEEYHDASFPEFSRRRSPDVIYHYDTPAGEISLGDGTMSTAVNTRGFLAWVEDASGEEHLSYDERGHIHWTVKRLPDPLIHVFVSYQTELEYDTLDRLAAVTYPDHDRITYQYNQGNQLEAILGGPNGNIITTLNYSPAGQKVHCAYGNGVHTGYGYDQRLRLHSLVTTPGDISTDPFLNYRYQLDPASNLTQIDDRRSGAKHPEGDPHRNTQIFTYDDLYRLTKVRYSFNLPDRPEREDGRIDFRYDRIGNMLSKTADFEHVENGLSLTELGEMNYGGQAGAWNRTDRDFPTPGPHALTSASIGYNYPYDANGNMTNLDGLQCVWDFKNRLVSAENDRMRAEYVYDYTDRRILKTLTPKDASGEFITSETAHSRYINRYFEIRDDEQPTKYVWNGNARTAQITGTLDPEQKRIQRIRLFPGWNLFVAALDVEAESVVPDNDSGEMMFQWNPDRKRFERSSKDDSIPAGALIWIHVEAPRILILNGNLPDTPPVVESKNESGFIPNLRLQTAELGNFAQRDLVLWRFDPRQQKWRASAGFTSEDPPVTLAPGECVFVRLPNTSTELSLEYSDAIHFYHRDHLASVAGISGSAGALLHEIHYYPFGSVRAAQAKENRRPNYTFTQKEFDEGTDLFYFEARYYSSRLARFLSADPISAHAPQSSNTYSYSLNNPLNLTDPTGLQGNPVEVPSFFDDPGKYSSLKSEFALSPGVGATAKVLGIGAGLRIGADLTYGESTGEESYFISATLGFVSFEYRRGTRDIPLHDGNVVRREWVEDDYFGGSGYYVDTGQDFSKTSLQFGPFGGGRKKVDDYLNPVEWEGSAELFQFEGRVGPATLGLKSALEVTEDWISLKATGTTPVTKHTGRADLVPTENFVRKSIQFVMDPVFGRFYRKSGRWPSPTESYRRALQDARNAQSED